MLQVAGLAQLEIGLLPSRRNAERLRTGRCAVRTVVCSFLRADVRSLHDVRPEASGDLLTVGCHKAATVGRGGGGSAGASPSR